ncbi:unnamed protein product, partial [Choristocarpus tenellus]
MALSLVRSRRQPLPVVQSGGGASAAHGGGGSGVSGDPVPKMPAELPLSRMEMSRLRGGTSQEERGLEDWHPESLLVLWCSSLLESSNKRGPPGRGSELELANGVGGEEAWERGRGMVLSVLRWVCLGEQGKEPGVTAGTIVPFLAREAAAAVVAEGVKEGMGRDGGAERGIDVLTVLRSNLETHLIAMSAAAGESGTAKGGSNVHQDGGLSGLGVKPPLGTAKISSSLGGVSSCKGGGSINGMGVPSRLLGLSQQELLALKALLDEALADSNKASTSSSAANVNGSAVTSVGTTDSVDSMASSARVSSFTGKVPGAEVGRGRDRSALGMDSSVRWDSCVRIFLLARGLRERLIAKNKVKAEGGGVESVNGAGLSWSGVEADKVASSAALAMLLSSSDMQRSVLEEVCPLTRVGVGAEAGGRGSGGLTWDEARALLLPVWVKDIGELRRVTEVAAANTFRQDKDLMSAALFFVILGKERTLLALAKADKPFVGSRALSGSERSLHTAGGRAEGASAGQRLERLLAHDFTTPQGRAVSEKNAYILLRKRRYKAAAAVFLLARPAMLKEALQVILVHTKDLQLALLVARLVERRDAEDIAAGEEGWNGEVGAESGGGWERVGEGLELLLDGASRKLLREEFLPTYDGEGATRRRVIASFGGTRSASPPPTPVGDHHKHQRDAFLEAVTLHWLGEPERALRALCRGRAANEGSSSLSTSGEVGNGKGRRLKDSLQALGMCNRAIDVASRPLLVSYL